jgi:hypothetical protein
MRRADQRLMGDRRHRARCVRSGPEAPEGGTLHDLPADEELASSPATRWRTAGDSKGREQIRIPRFLHPEGGAKMIDQLASAMAAIALIAVLLVAAFFHIEQIPGPSTGNQPSVQVADRR